MRGKRTGQRCIRFAVGSSVVAFLWLTTGCGAPAAPQPPTLNLPQPVADLAAVRAGSVVRLTCTVPAKTTDKLPFRGAVTAVLCRSVDSGACTRIHTETVRAQQSVSMDDSLPADLAGGAAHLLTYQVTLQNSAGKAADASNAAYAAAGAGPAAVAGFQATPSRNGIVLTWQASSMAQPTLLRFTRSLTAGAPPPAASAPPSLGAPRADAEPAEQTLQVPESASDGANTARSLDATALKGRSYRYTAQRIERISLMGKALEIASAPSATVSVEYRDIFPPPVPAGLVSAADTPDHAIDLSWSPVSDPHLNGYLVYRRNLSGSTAPERLTTADKPLHITAFSDATAVPGQRYAYSVTAVDAAGNESARSAEVEDGLPVKIPDSKATQP